MTQAAVPILGGSGFILISLVAVLLDLIDERQREEARANANHRPPDPIWIRCVSAITYVPTSRSAVCFFSGTVLFLVCTSLTGTWQSQLESDSNSSILVSSIVMSASICLLSLGAWINRVNEGLGMVLHMPLAGVFQACVIVYGFATVNLAKNWHGNAAPTTIARQIVLYIALVCLVLSFLWLSLCNQKMIKLVAHMRAEESMVQRQDTARSFDGDEEEIIQEAQEEVKIRKDSSSPDKGGPDKKQEEDPPVAEEEQQGTAQEDAVLLSAEERLSCRRYEAALATVQYALGTCAGLLLALGAADM